MSPKPLDDQFPGRPLRIAAVEGQRAVRRRLLELGLLPGTDLQLIRKSKLAGTIELEIRCCRFTLSLEQAHRVLVHAR
ncbi:MAG: FeoA domain-containing protein [Planctomycetota bacterium]